MAQSQRIELDQQRTIRGMKIANAYNGLPFEQAKELPEFLVSARLDFSAKIDQERAIARILKLRAASRRSDHGRAIITQAGSASPVPGSMHGKCDVVGGAARRRRIVGHRMGNGAALDDELKRLLGGFRKTNHARLSVTIRADFDLRLSHTEKTVSNQRADLGIVNWLARSVLDDEIRLAWADLRIDLGNLRSIRDKRHAACRKKNNSSEQLCGAQPEQSHLENPPLEKDTPLAFALQCAKSKSTRKDSPQDGALVTGAESPMRSGKGLRTALPGNADTLPRRSWRRCPWKAPGSGNIPACRRAARALRTWPSADCLRQLRRKQ